MSFSVSYHHKLRDFLSIYQYPLPWRHKFAFKYLKHEVDGLALECIFTDVSI